MFQHINIDISVFYLFSDELVFFKWIKIKHLNI